ncbi:MAG: hypothetical protein CMO74_12950 [Verrucomicrobiales bacterium]|nr:hypothetical protein [Verrucomicrobiales bacterium]
MKLTISHKGNFKRDESIDSLYTSREILLEGNASCCWKLDSGDVYYLFGEVFGIRDSNTNELSRRSINISQEYLQDPRKVSDLEGRFVVVKITEDDKCSIWTDQFGRIDVYWQEHEGQTIASTEMKCLPVANSAPEANMVGIAHALVVYGSRPAKMDTLYKDVMRLGVGEVLNISRDNITIDEENFQPLQIEEYTESDLHKYSDIFIETIRARGSHEGNVVYLSSGWDSTSILAVLVHCFGNKKVRAVIGRMRYSERAGVINQFEIDRAQAIADYYNVPLEICELDYRNGAPEILDEVRTLFRSQQFANLTGFNHWKLAKHVARTASCDEVVFAGEISDGAHNLGFSQYVSIFHPSSIDFREYSDKMASHLFGPTFLKDILEDKHEANPVWQIYRNRNVSVRFDMPLQGKKGRIEQFLASFFLSQGRLPFYSIENSRMLSAQGQRDYSESMKGKYLKDAANSVSPDNLYSWYLHLYHSFHWQGATVATLEHTLEAHKLTCALPFIDSKILEYLAKMPESWGRGLDFKPTKYPLKWMLKNRIKYPIELQTGPHSYIYDIDPSFSHIGEIMHNSSFTKVFKNIIKEKSYINNFSEEWFCHEYIAGIENKYLSGDEMRGDELNDLASLSMLSTIGMYGD